MAEHPTDNDRNDAAPSAAVSIEPSPRPGNRWYYRIGVVCLEVDYDNASVLGEWPAMFWISNPGYLSLETAIAMKAVLEKALEEIDEWKG